MIGDGCCAFVSITLRGNKKEDAHRSIGNAILLCILGSILLTAIYLIFMEPILTLFGGKVNAETYACAKEYFFWIALSIWYLCHMKAVKLERHSFGIWRNLMKKFLALGITSFLAQISLVISMAAVQNMCTQYGAAAAVGP